MGGDRLGRLMITARQDVSIHAPAWGATFCEAFLPIWSHGFNPRPRMGGDPIIHQVNSLTSSFNPRPRMGGDPLRVE